ncbi:MAG: DEAD/DEAH box helicase, partial [Exiguobacterium mexicanum]
MSIHPIQATARLQDRYMDYMTSYFKINDGDLNQQFIDGLRHDKQFLKGPYLEATLPYKPGRQITDLVDDGTVHPDITRFLPGEDNFRLYLHQERAIRTAKNGQSFVVATGTGSGKTESFILPIFNHLLTQRDNGQLNDGVRALLLYPMNALANDQLDRLRELLKDTPNITFGRFTGETIEKTQDARKSFYSQHGKNPLPNERLSREEIRRNPPHILLTNYAMLEYLMMRPEDNALFSGHYRDHWRFVVLD